MTITNNIKPEKQIERLVAKKIKLDDLNKGRYVKEDNEFSSNYILLSNSDKVSRVNIIGVNVMELPDSFVLDDGNFQIQVRPFNKEFPNNKVGSLLCVIGRAREYNSTKYIIPEIIKEINNKLWKQVRELELKYLDSIVNKKINETYERYEKKDENIVKENIKELDKNENNYSNEEIIVEEVEDVREGKEEENIFNIIYTLVTTLDKGEGVTIEEIKKHVKRYDCEKIIKKLIEDGEVFEIRPGKIKIL